MLYNKDDINIMRLAYFVVVYALNESNEKLLPCHDCYVSISLITFG